MRGLMPALVGLLAATALRLALALVPAGAAHPGFPALAIFAATFGLVLWKNPHPAVLMLGAAWLYKDWIVGNPAMAPVFLGVQIAVLAIILRAVQRIGTHILEDRLLWLIAAASLGATLAGVP